MSISSGARVMDKNLMSEASPFPEALLCQLFSSFNKLSQSWSPTVGSNSLGSSLSMPDKSSTPTVDLLETPLTQLKEFDNSMSAARLYCKVARSEPWYQSRDKSIHVVPLDEGVPYYHFNFAAAELKALVQFRILSTLKMTEIASWSLKYLDALSSARPKVMSVS